MDYLKAISDAAAHSATSGHPLIFRTNGLIIMALLFVIYWCLIRDKRRRRREEFPRFCDNCFFLFHFRLGFCMKKCKYHPAHKNSATTSYYQEKAPYIK